MVLQELANLPTAELIEIDGSPSGLKLFMLWNPPLCLKTVRFCLSQLPNIHVKSVLSGIKLIKTSCIISVFKVRKRKKTSLEAKRSQSKHVVAGRSR